MTAYPLRLPCVYVSDLAVFDGTALLLGKKMKRTLCCRSGFRPTGNPRIVPKRTLVIDKDDRSLQISEACSVTGNQLWHGSVVARAKANVRLSTQCVVMGGESGIRRVWKQFNIRPNVVYVPDNRDVPEWCDSAALPTIVVRCPPIDINRSLLHSLHNDGYAAEFPLQTPPSIESAIDPENRSAVSMPIILA